MKDASKSIIALGIVSALSAIPATSWSWGVTTNLNNNMNKSYNQRYDNSDRSQTRVGGSLTTTSDSNNRTTFNRNDNRDYSDHSTQIDGRGWSDSRDQGDHSRKDSNDLGAYSRFNSHNAGDNSVILSGGYSPQVGHDKATVESFQGSNNQIDNSVSGYFGVGNTTQK